MAYRDQSNSIIRKEFFKPLFQFFNSAKHRRSCPVLDDALWLEAGVRRCLGIFQSGRDFIQHLADRHDADVNLSTFFESLKSKRRLLLVDEISILIRNLMRREIPDPFTCYQCLDGFDLYAGDGHFIAAASHDPTYEVERESTQLDIPTDSRITKTKYATGHLYTLDLRTHAANHIAVSDQVERKKEHDLRTLKRQDIATLRQGAAKGRKVLYIWDRAGIDFRQWYQWKHQSGIYFLSRHKDNMKLYVIGDYGFDQKLEINKGVLSDQIVGTSQGVQIRRVIYQDPSTGIIYTYIGLTPKLGQF